MLKRLKKVFTPRRPDDGAKIIVNCEKLEQRVALLEEGILEEYTVERTDEVNIVGSIYKGVVRNIEPGLKAMFVDIGLEKNAFLHFWDAIPEALDSGLEEIQRVNKDADGKGKGGRRKKPKRITAADIPNLYPVGSEVLVQVTKGPIGTKGPRITTNISLAGRFMVLMPRNEQFGISRKVDDPKERARLRRVMEKLRLPEGMGIILRTVSVGQRLRFFVRDLSMLLDQWEAIELKAHENKAPVCAFQEPDLIERTVRDFLTDEISEVLCDDLEAVDRMKDLVGLISRRSKKRIHHYESHQPIFEKHGIQKQIDDAFYRQVWLPSGGYLVIDETEALISIDVNTGRAKSVDKMLLKTNLEAAAEAARQLRLRNIGGLVVIDFIDMKARRDQQAVYRLMKERAARDKAKTQVLPISQLGLMEMTRQRLHESLSVTVSEPCPYCNGRGRVKSATTMSVELQRQISSVLVKHRGKVGELVIVVHPDVMERLRTQDDESLVDLQRRHETRFTFRSDPTFHREQVVIADAESGKELNTQG
jgi:ribonuclease G